MVIIRRRSSGFTISELMVSIGIMSFIFSFMAYLIFMSSKNALNIHDQIVSQTQAASATERVVQTLRNACFFSPVNPDDPSDDSTSITRIRFASPGPTGASDDLEWGQVRFEPPAVAGGYGRLEVFMDEGDVGGTPDYKFGHINAFGVQFETASRLTLTLRFNYSGFGLGEAQDLNDDGVPDNALSGAFVTDVIAKNHNVGEGFVNYGQTSTTIARL